MITADEAGLNKGHVVLQVEPNFTLDIHKPSLTDAIKVLIQVNGLTMKPDESALAIHHTMTYKVQTHLFSMSSTGRPITRFLSGDVRVFQPRTYRQNQLIFHHNGSMSMKKATGLNRSMRFQKLAGYKKGGYQFLFPLRQKPSIHVRSPSLKESIPPCALICQEEPPPVES